MTDDERAALVEQIARIVAPEGFPSDVRWHAPSHRAAGLVIAEAILAAIEGPIRADERARVVAEATKTEAIVRACSVEWRSHASRMLSMRAAIRAALGVAGPDA